MSSQEQADQLAGALAGYVAGLGGPGDGEIAIIIRVTVDGTVVSPDGVVSQDVLWTWDWFRRPKGERS